jgi:tetratricopeptide (TPR) repeat protein
MNTETTTTQQPEAPAHDLQHAIDFFKRYGHHCSIALSVVLLAVIGFQIHAASGRKAVRTAAEKLASVKTLQELDALVADYPKAPTTPLALLRLAKAHFDGGNYDAALAKYTEFSLKYGTHPLADGAEMGRIHCMEARGQFNEAASAFAAFVAAHPNHFLAPQAMFGQGRCLEQLGRDSEAKILYEDFIAAHPDSEWRSRAEEALALAKSRLAGVKNPIVSAPDKK